MKNWMLSFFLFLGAAASAQDTCHLKHETDPFTHVTKVSTGFVPFTNGAGKVSISVDATPTDIDIFIWLTSDPKCFDDQSTVLVNYDGDRMKATFHNSGSMNCEGAFHMNFRNGASIPSALQRMTERKVKSLRLTGNSGTPTDIVLTEEQKAQLLRMVSCVVAEAKGMKK